MWQTPAVADSALKDLLQHVILGILQCLSAALFHLFVLHIIVVGLSSTSRFQEPGMIYLWSCFRCIDPRRLFIVYLDFPMARSIVFFYLVLLLDLLIRAESSLIVLSFEAWNDRCSSVVPL